MSHAPCTLFWPRTGATPEFGLPIWCVMQAMAAAVCTASTFCFCWHTPMPQQMMADGSAVAYMRAASRIIAGSMPVMSCVASGVYFSMVFHHSSKPKVCSRTNS